MRRVNYFKDANNSRITIEDFSEKYYLYKVRNNNFFDTVERNLVSLKNRKIRGSREWVFLENLISNFKSIIKATPEKLNEYKVIYTTGNFRWLNTPVSISFKSEILEVFDYKNFRTRAKLRWFAGHFDIKSCLYCNAQFAHVTGAKGRVKKVLFQFDHFYDKSTYPYFSLSWGNLIPCCVSCNQTKKKGELNLHPFMDNYEEKFKFYVENYSVFQYLLNNRNDELLDLKIITRDDNLRQDFDVLKILDTYLKHKDLIGELVIKAQYYNKSKRDELIEQFDFLNIDKQMFDRLIVGSYTLAEHINKRPLSKLTQDISRQLMLIE